jgi:hypothetical protein
VFTQTELIYLSDEQLRLLRNSIYANHGYIFKSRELADYFAPFRLHRPNPSFSESEFSETEKTNLQNIIAEENWRK